MGLIPWRLMKIKICIANNPIPEQTSETRNKQLEKSITFQTCDLIPCSLTPCRSHNHFYNWSHRFESNHWHWVIEFVNSAVYFPQQQKVFLTKLIFLKVTSNTTHQCNTARRESFFFNCRLGVYLISCMPAPVSPWLSSSLSESDLSPGPPGSQWPPVSRPGRRWVWTLKLRTETLNRSGCRLARPSSGPLTWSAVAADQRRTELRIAEWALTVNWVGGVE